MTAARTPQPKDRLDAFLDAINHHEVDQAMSSLAEDFHLVFVGFGVSMTKEETRGALAWDAGANGRVSYTQIEILENTITGILTEENDFLRLVGIPELKSRNTYVLDEQGLINQQLYEPIPGQPSFQEAMQPAVTWAVEYRAAELAEIYPDNQMIYTEDMARRWVTLLQEWCEATASNR